MGCSVVFVPLDTATNVNSWTYTASDDADGPWHFLVGNGKMITNDRYSIR